MQNACAYTNCTIDVVTCFFSQEPRKLAHTHESQLALEKPSNVAPLLLSKAFRDGGDASINLLKPERTQVAAETLVKQQKLDMSAFLQGFLIVSLGFPLGICTTNSKSTSGSNFPQNNAAYIHSCISI